jgi:hypothetical protein
VTRSGLLLGSCIPVAAALAAVSLLVPGPLSLALLLPGVLLGAACWFALPAIPLLVATRVLRKEQA